MEKFINTHEERRSLLRQIPDGFVNLFEVPAGTENSAINSIVVNLDHGHINNWYALNSEFKRTDILLNGSGNRISDFEENGVEEIETDPTRKEVQLFIFKNWQRASKIHISDLYQYLSFKREKVNLFYFNHRHIEGFALHKGEFDLNDPKGLVRVFFSNNLSLEDIIDKILLKKDIAITDEYAYEVL